MKVVEVYGGLASQMVKYAFYLYLKENCTDDCYIDLSYYGAESQWNGYELEKLFGVDAPDFYKQNVGTNLEDFENYWEYTKDKILRVSGSKKLYFYDRAQRSTVFMQKSRIKDAVARRINKLKNQELDIYPEGFLDDKVPAFFGECNLIDSKYLPKKETLKAAFKFNDFDTEQNIKVSKEMKSTDSVALHVRRTDKSDTAKQLFDEGYYKKATNYVKEKCENPVFYIFSDDVNWCEENLEILGLNENDRITFVDWNRGQDSYRDMQLMMLCKHNILANSGFSWLAEVLSSWDEKDKIVVAPKAFWPEAGVHL